MDRYIALTEFSKSRFVDSGVLAEENVSVKPNFIDDPRTARGRDVPKKKQALFIGRLWPEKGCRVLVQAWVEASKRMSGLNGYELLIIGDGPERRAAETLCLNRPGEYSICFAGTMPREKVLETLAHSSFLVLPSIWYEGFPMTIVESFACGVPILSAALGSMLSIIEEKRTGLFFEAGNTNQLAEQIIWAVSHEEQMGAMGRNARLQFEGRYTHKTNLTRLVEIYRQLPARQNGSRA